MALIPTQGQIMCRERSHREVPLSDSFWKWMWKGKFFGSADELPHSSLSGQVFCPACSAEGWGRQCHLCLRTQSRDQHWIFCYSPWQEYERLHLFLWRFFVAESIQWINSSVCSLSKISKWGRARNPFCFPVIWWHKALRFIYHLEDESKLCFSVALICMKRYNFCRKIQVLLLHSDSPSSALL